MEDRDLQIEDLKSLTVAQLAGLGEGHVGYIRQIETDEGIRGADGSQLATAETEAAALFAAEHLEIEPVTLQ